MSQISDLLRILIDAGPRFPAAAVRFNEGMTLITQGLGEFQAGAMILLGQEPKPTFAGPKPWVAHSDQEQTLFNEANAVLVEHGGIESETFGAAEGGGFLSSLLAFLQAHPELLTLLLSLLKK